MPRLSSVGAACAAAYGFTTLTGNVLVNYLIVAGGGGGNVAIGGYLGGDSWQVNSGITKIVDCDTFWEIHGFSGSIYNCHKTVERLNGMTSSIYNKWCKDSNEELAIKMIPISDCLPTYEQKGNQ